MGVLGDVECCDVVVYVCLVVFGVVFEVVGVVCFGYGLGFFVVQRFGVHFGGVRFAVDVDFDLGVWFGFVRWKVCHFDVDVHAW